MGFWKILGGIAAGVGAVALLPVAGAVGAVTATGAIVGGAVGAAVAAGTDDEDEKKRLREENERTSARCAIATSKAQKMVAESKEKVASAQEKAKQAEQRAAEVEKSLQEAAETMERYRESLKDVESHYQLVIALTAIGMAAAKADGDVDERETSEMDEYISGIAASKLPAKVKARIQYLHNHPPTFEKAAEEIMKLDKDGLPIDVFRQLIVDVINADGIVKETETAFLGKWDAMVANGLIPVKTTPTRPVKKAKAPKIPDVSAKQTQKVVSKNSKKNPVKVNSNAQVKATTSKAGGSKAPGRGSAKKPVTRKQAVKSVEKKAARTKKVMAGK